MDFTNNQFCSNIDASAIAWFTQSGNLLRQGNIALAKVDLYIGGHIVEKDGAGNTLNEYCEFGDFSGTQGQGEVYRQGVRHQRFCRRGRGVRVAVGLFRGEIL